jgi:vacuolar-type H+-ATPase subunit I/STV1
MGCCGAQSSYPEIDEANSIDELYKELNDKLNQIQTEIKELDDYLLDKSNIPKTVDVSYLSDIEISNRKTYLETYEKSLENINNIISQNRDMDIYKTKDQIHSLFDCYYLKDDKQGNLKKIENNIKIIAQNSKT